MTFTRRAFAAIALTIAPFLGAKATPVQVSGPEVLEPEPKVIDEDIAVWEAHDPFDLILGEALGLKTVARYPADHTWVNGFGWVPSSQSMALVDRLGGNKYRFPLETVAPQVRAQGPTKYKPTIDTTLEPGQVVVDAKPYQNRRTWIAETLFRNDRRENG